MTAPLPNPESTPPRTPEQIEQDKQMKRIMTGVIIGAVEQKARVLRDALGPLATHRHVGDIRQAGLMCGIELVADRQTKASFPPGDRNGYHVCLALRDRGVFLRPLGDVLALMPPLSSTDAELRHLATSVHAAIVERFGA